MLKINQKKLNKFIEKPYGGHGSNGCLRRKTQMQPSHRGDRLSGRGTAGMESGTGKLTPDSTQTAQQAADSIQNSSHRATLRSPDRWAVSLQASKTFPL